MRCERLLVFLLLFVACSRESAAPQPPDPTPPRDLQQTATAPPAAVEPTPVPPSEGTYDQAITWLRATPGFAFVLDEGEVHAEGRMRRATVGAESIEFKANGEEWRAKSGAQGVTWERRSGGKWSVTAAPLYGNRLFQRVTLAFDPQKKEGAAQLAGSGGTSNHYRFTNANSGEVHEVWVAKSDSHVERIKIGDSFDMQITP
jgi:hypothetical protein